jgi:5'-3' exonuclease
MLCDLIIDGNYLLSKLVFTLHKNNLLFGALYKSLEASVNNYRKWYPFANVYLVSDSKEKSWRKKLNRNYKTNRKRDTAIDWDFVYSCYGDFKNDLKNKGIKVLESPGIEGDDWISFIIERSNQIGRSTITVSNDHDIKQLIRYSKSPVFINLMVNEMQSRQKVFLPKNYQILILELTNKFSDDIFELNDNSDFLKLIKSFTERNEIFEVDPVECLIVKLISGDSSDNISSAWSVEKNGKKRGIGQSGATGIYQKYIEEFGEMNLSDPDLLENIADLIAEKKKISSKTIPEIASNLRDNQRIISLEINNFPREIINKMNEIYTNL